MKLNNFLKLVIAIGVSELAGVVGSVFMVSTSSPQAISGLDWYAGIVKPALNPPSWVFGPVWTTLFALMGIAAFLVWSSYAEASADKKKGIKVALILFGIQLVLNTLWSIIFFGSTSLTINGLNNIGIALVDIIFLWLAILATIVAFYKISKSAAWLLAPYLLWVSFAAYLNYSIYVLN